MKFVIRAKNMSSIAQKAVYQKREQANSKTTRDDFVFNLWISGDRCERVDYCASSPCSAGEICSNGPSSAVCRANNSCDLTPCKVRMHSYSLARTGMEKKRKARVCLLGTGQWRGNGRVVCGVRGMSIPALGAVIIRFR